MAKPWVGHRMTYVDPVCDAEVGRLRAGEDPRPPGEGELMTAAQLWHELLESSSFHRLRILDKFIDAVADADRCFLEHGNLEGEQDD